MADEIVHIKYPSISAFDRVRHFYEGHRVWVFEKVDGSNVAIGKTEDGQVWLQGHHKLIDPAKYEPIFRPFVTWATSEPVQAALRTIDGPFVLYGEMLNSNKLKYKQRSPFVLFDVLQTRENVFVQGFVPLNEWAFLLKCEVTPLVWSGPFEFMPDPATLIGPSHFDDTLLAEGVVIKAHKVDYWYYVDGEKRVVPVNMMAGKYVREGFQEIKPPKPEIVDPLDRIADSLFTTARFDKIVTSLVEEGKSLDTPNDLMRLFMVDVLKEESENIRQQLEKAYLKQISSRIQKSALAEYRTRKELGCLTPS